jgi:hypothetical protein
LVSEAKGRFYKNSQEHYFVYVPLGVAEDSLFPLQLRPDSSIPVKVIFNAEKKQLIIEKWTASSEKTN